MSNAESGIPQADLRQVHSLLEELFGDEFVGSYSLGEGGNSIQARVWVEGRPYLHIFVRDANGDFKPAAMHSLARARL